MGVADKLAAMAQYANEVQDLLDKEVELLDFAKRGDANGQEQLVALTKTGTLVYPKPEHAATFAVGGWWFATLVREGGKIYAVPITKFSPDLYFEAKPIERLWVEKTFEREQKQFTTEVQGDVIEWTPISREITIQPNGRVDLGEFAQHFNGRAFANVGKAKGEAAPLLGIAPTQSPNAYKVESDQLVVPRLDKMVRLTGPTTFPAEWNDERKMLLVYLEGVVLPAKA
ncbi:MAG: hypothetical protein HYT80_01355 [Euryarchaeota archaeon]|nr:hypothetical protein [Euryarchaeota archaeon]